MTSVHVAENEVEALMLRGILEEAGIPVVVRSRQRSPHREAVDPLELYLPGTAWQERRELLVPNDRIGEARALLSEYLASLEDEART